MSARIKFSLAVWTYARMVFAMQWKQVLFKSSLLGSALGYSLFRKRVDIKAYLTNDLICRYTFNLQAWYRRRIFLYRKCKKTGGNVCALLYGYPVCSRRFICTKVNSKLMQIILALGESSIRSLKFQAAILIALTQYIQSSLPRNRVSVSSTLTLVATVHELQSYWSARPDRMSLYAKKAEPIHHGWVSPGLLHLLNKLNSKLSFKKDCAKLHLRSLDPVLAALLDCQEKALS